jgi:ribA/ribD-fused uncharacterized protein
MIMIAVVQFAGDYDWLSNFYVHPFRIEGVSEWWNSAEHAFQAAKATTPELYRKIRDARTPGEAKRLGRIADVRPSVWNGQRREIMMRVLMAKFSIPELRERLAATGTAALVEGNTWGDTYWGAVPEGGKGWNPDLPWWHFDDGTRVYAGQNWLGRELMMVRELIS